MNAVLFDVPINGWKHLPGVSILALLEKRQVFQAYNFDWEIKYLFITQTFYQEPRFCIP